VTDGLWQAGKIEISPDDVRFIDAQEPAKHDAKGDWVVNERGHRAVACGVAVVEYLLEDRSGSSLASSKTGRVVRL
jgi:hypothetical protein